jgi:hypothetical protein
VLIWRFVKMGLAAILLVSLSFVIFMVFKLWPFGADVPLFRTPEWKDKRIGELYSGRLQLRRKTEAGGALLLKRLDVEPVYQYDPQTGTFSAVTDKEWLNASGPTAKCMDELAKPNPVQIGVDNVTHKLIIAGREVPTAASLALGSQSSPSGKWLAVLSATGPAISLFSMMSGDRVLGRRYHEVKSLPDAVSSGHSIQIPVVDTITTLQLCWSADEKFVVYNDGSFSSLVVVETNLDSRNQ